MSLFPENSSGTLTPAIITPYAFSQSEATALSNTAATKNLVYWNPITIPFDYTIVRFGWSTYNQLNSTRDLNIGIYTSDGTKMYETGDTTFTSPATSSAHFITPASPVFLPAGTYYIANKTTAGDVTCGMTHITLGGAERGRLDNDVYMEANHSGPLPSTMSSAVKNTGLQQTPLITLHRT